MPGLLYYLAGSNIKEVAEKLKALYPQALAKSSIERGVRGGPDGKSGFIFSASSLSEPENVAYYPDQQTWTTGRDGSYVGRYQGFQPSDVAKDIQLRGHLVTLGDENDWLIPCAIGFAEIEGSILPYTALPAKHHLNGNGTWVAGEVVDHLAGFWQLAERYFEHIKTEGTEEGAMSFSDRNALAAEAIMINYRIGPHEIGALGLLTSLTLDEVCYAALDFPSLEGITKKKRIARDGSDSSDGDRDSTGLTGQRSPILSTSST